MKRWFSVALMLALLGSTSLAPARAEEAEIVSGNVEAEVAPAQWSGDNGLTVDGEPAAEQAPQEASEESPEVNPTQSNYARIQAEALLSQDAEGANPLAILDAGSVALVLESAPRARVALYTPRGVLTGYVDAACLVPLTDEEIGAYLDAAAAGAPVALFEDNLELPLALTECAFTDAEQPAPADEAPATDTAPLADEEAAIDTAPLAEEEAALLIEADETFPEGEEAAVLATDAASSADQVQTAEEAAAQTAATGIRLSASSLSIGLKERYDGLTAVALPEGSALPAITWRSDKPKVVSVDPATGAVTGLKKGTANIYAKPEGGEEVKCKVTVKNAAKKITLKSASLTLGEGMTRKLETSLPKGYASARLYYSSSKKSVVTVAEDGTITAVAPGTATVTVKTFNKKASVKCKVKVLAAPASVRFPREAMGIAVNQTVSLGAVAADAKGKDTVAAITYAVDASSSDPECVKLDAATGKVTGVRKGKAVITATTHNGVVAVCEVSVAAAPVSVKMNLASATLGLKEVYTRLEAVAVAPEGEDACADTVTWSSSNKKIATVDAATGAVTAIKTGSCTITAKTCNGKTAKCKITVKKAPGKITSLTPKEGNLVVGQSGDYKIKLPKNTGGSVTFESSNPEIAAVDDFGHVTGIAPGDVTITATTYNGHSAKVSLHVIAGGDNSDDTTNQTGSSNAEKLEYVISVAQSKLGKPYVYGSFGPNSFDCSGFTTYCFRQINIELKHSAYTQGYDSSMQQLTVDELRRGDLVFFDTVTDDDLSDHAGIYLGDGKFIHASSSAKKVIVSTLASGYYSRVFSWGRRVLN